MFLYWTAKERNF